VKRWLDRGFDPDAETRGKEPIEPVSVGPLEAGPQRPSYVVPVAIAGVAILVLGAAMFGHFGFFSSKPTPTPTIPAPTPIAWVDTTVAPTSSVQPGDQTLEPGASMASAATPLKLYASLTAVSNLLHRDTPGDFTLYLANPNSGPISLAPCPTYRMYITGIDNATAPVRLLNCSAIGPALLPDATIALDMVYTPGPDTPLTGLKLVWQLETPDTVQAIATMDISIGP
jgi:hypothetical protein